MPLLYLQEREESMTYVLFTTCILVFIMFGFYIMHKIDTFFSSEDFMKYSDFHYKTRKKILKHTRKIKKYKKKKKNKAD